MYLPDPRFHCTGNYQPTNDLIDKTHSICVLDFGYSSSPCKSNSSLLDRAVSFPDTMTMSSVAKEIWCAEKCFNYGHAKTSLHTCEGFVVGGGKCEMKHKCVSSGTDTVAGGTLNTIASWAGLGTHSTSAFQCATHGGVCTCNGKVKKGSVERDVMGWITCNAAKFNSGSGSASCTCSPSIITEERMAAFADIPKLIGAVTVRCTGTTWAVIKTRRHTLDRDTCRSPSLPCYRTPWYWPKALMYV